MSTAAETVEELVIHTSLAMMKVDRSTVGIERWLRELSKFYNSEED
jgi:hypothetical protein